MKKHLPPGLFVRAKGARCALPRYHPTSPLAWPLLEHGTVVVLAGGRSSPACPMLNQPAVTGASVRHYSARLAFPPDASGAMFRVLSGAGSQLPRLSGALLECAYSSPSQACVKLSHQGTGRGARVSRSRTSACPISVGHSAPDSNRNHIESRASARQGARERACCRSSSRARLPGRHDRYVLYAAGSASASARPGEGST